MTIPYANEIKWAVIVLGFAGWSFGCYTTGERLERAAWEKKESEKKDDVIEFKTGSEKDSQAGGQKYAKKQAAIQKTLTTPDQGLDHEMQGPAGDVVLPGSLGLRLNALMAAGQASAAASQPD